MQLFSSFVVIAAANLRGIATSYVTTSSCHCLEYNADGSTKPSTECGWNLSADADAETCKTVGSENDCTIVPQEVFAGIPPVAVFKFGGSCTLKGPAEDESPPFNPARSGIDTVAESTSPPTSPTSPKTSSTSPPTSPTSPKTSPTSPPTSPTVELTAEPTSPPTVAEPLPAAPPIVFSNQGVPDFSLRNQDFTKYSFDFSISSIKCTDVNIGKLEVRARKLTDADKVAYSATDKAAELDLTATDIGMKCTAEYDYELDFWPHVPRGGGSVSLAAGGDSKINSKVNVHGLGFGVTAPPMLKMIDGTCSGKVDVLDNTIHFSGGLSGSILNKFKSDMAGVVEKLASEQLCSAVGKILGDLDTGIFSSELMLLNMMVAR